MTPVVLVASAAIISTLGYALLCYASPFGRCRKCKGKRRVPNRIRRGSRHCRRCDATGLRLRLGRHVWNSIRHLHHDGTGPRHTK
ncbi:hypothetical protein [Nonomuraea cavernae]|uniref:Uncharacterized protein n=1 Tax=Nonomuraea cavernae TaxID=2045107 RepID=A0A917YW48_9ACTN|nr:hypothetical protein [Nonomuraea cavernae]MCA2186945.1 hypothetical protein [Nonomuraea cavernae]GGO67105.1 hypothetical protein GCM10012289_22740 [Nonomuraea cavernae]